MLFLMVFRRSPNNSATAYSPFQPDYRSNTIRLFRNISALNSFSALVNLPCESPQFSTAGQLNDIQDNNCKRQGCGGGLKAPTSTSSGLIQAHLYVVGFLGKVQHVMVKLCLIPSRRSLVSIYQL